MTRTASKRRVNRTPNETLRVIFGTDTRACVARILARWDSASPYDVARGARWYSDALAFAELCANETGVSVPRAVAVLAHTSPKTAWNLNKRVARAVLRGDAIPAGAMSGNVERARAALGAPSALSTLPDGRKTFYFAGNIMGNGHAVTVDKWALRVALGYHDVPDSQLGRVGAYDAVARAYVLAAGKRGVSPAVMQAVTWIVARNGRHA